MLCVAPEDVRSTLDELERASLLQMLPEMSGAETGEGLRNAGKMTRAYRLSDFFATGFTLSGHTLPSCIQSSSAIFCLLFLSNSLQASFSAWPLSIFVLCMIFGVGGGAARGGKKSIIPVFNKYNLQFTSHLG